MRLKSTKNFRHLGAVICSAVLILLGLPAVADTFREALQRGQAAESNGDDDAAVSAFVMAESMAPSPFNDARLRLARLYTKLSRYPEAESEYQLMLSATNELSVRKEYAKFLAQLGKFNSSMSIWSDILAKNPNDGDANYFMGVCLEALDNMDSATESYRKAASIGGNYASAASQKLSRLGKASDQRSAAKFFPIDNAIGAQGLGWWNIHDMPIHVYVDDGNGLPGYRPEMKNYVYKAMEAWRQASGGHFTFVMDPPDPKSESAWKETFGNNDALVYISTFQRIPQDPVNTGIHVHWVTNLGNQALGLAWTNALNKTKSGKMGNQLIQHAHVFLLCNAQADLTPIPEKITSANAGVLEKQDRMLSEVTIHEFGHVLGLPHSPNSRDIMCSGIYAFNALDIVESRSLSRGDSGSLAEHYNNYEGDGLPKGAVMVNVSQLKAALGPARSAVTGVSSYLTYDGESKGLIEEKKTPKVVSEMNNVMFNINDKHYDVALSQLNKILSESPKNSSALYLRGVVNVYLHKYPDAQKDYETVMKLAPNTDLARRAGDGLAKIKH